MTSQEEFGGLGVVPLMQHEAHDGEPVLRKPKQPTLKLYGDRLYLDHASTLQ